VLRDLSIGKGFVWKDLGETQLRGFADPVRLYELGWAAEVDQPARASSVDPARGNLFRREGEYWTIVYEGEAFRLKDTKGLRCLSQLLRNPGREFHAIDLVSIAQKREPLGAAQPGHEVVSRLGDAGKILDAQAKAEYRRRLDELREQLEEANRFNDHARSDALQSEIDFVTHELAAAFGRSGRDPKSASAAERARVNVTRTIADALRRIAEHNGSLSRHLENTVKTGTFCSYTPDPRVDLLVGFFVSDADRSLRAYDRSPFFYASSGRGRHRAWRLTPMDRSSLTRMQRSADNGPARSRPGEAGPC